MKEVIKPTSSLLSIECERLEIKVTREDDQINYIGTRRGFRSKRNCEPVKVIVGFILKDF